jgi:multiple sugar transport system substrate-binding protein
MFAKFKAAFLCSLFLAAMVIPGAHAETTIKIAYPGWDSKEQEKEVTGIFAAWEKQNPGVKVEIISIPFHMMKQKLVVSLRSGDAPDMGYVDGRWLQEMQAAGFLTDLTAYSSTLDKKDFFELPWKTATVGGKIYAVPDRIDPWMFYYNTDMFKAAGIREFPETMDELVEVCKKITIPDKQYGYGMVGANDATFIGRFLNILYAFHGDFLTPDGKKAAINNEAGIAAFQFYGDLLNKYKVAQPSAIANSNADVRKLLLTSQVGMMIDGPWATGTLRQQNPSLNWYVGQIPRVKDKKPRFTMSSWYYVIFSQSKVKEESKKFASYVLRPENQSRSVVTIPGRKSAAAMPRFQTKDWKPWVEAAPYGEPLPITDKFSQIADIVGNASQQVLSQKATAKQAADQAAEQINKLLK